MNDRVSTPLRLAPELLGKLKELAAADGRSLNAYVGRVLAYHVACTPTRGEGRMRLGQQSLAGVVTLPVPSRVRKARPNDACPCGSGAKYKKCHGRDASR